MNDQIKEILTEIQSLRNEIVELKSQVDDSSRKPRVKKPKLDKVCCKGITGKGTPCQNGAVEGTEYCRMHGERPPKPEKPKRIPRGTPKMKKIQPEHTHGLGLQCKLCETHGDVMWSGLTGEEFIGVSDYLVRTSGGSVTTVTISDD